MGTDAKKKDSRANGIDDRDKRYQRDAHPGEKINCVFQGIPLVRSTGVALRQMCS
jgi:hypothetical protein